MRGVLDKDLVQMDIGGESQGYEFCAHSRCFYSSWMNVTYCEGMFVVEPDSVESHIDFGVYPRQTLILGME